MKNRSKKQLIEIMNKQIFEMEKEGQIFISKNSMFEKFLNIKNIQYLINHITTHKFRQTMMFYLQFNNYYISSETERMYALDYLRYVINSDPEIPLNYFPKMDHAEILKYTRNKILIALNGNVKIENIFDKKDLVAQKKYKAIQKNSTRIIPFQGYEACKFRSKYYSFTENVLIERCGTNEIRNKKGIKGTTIIDCGTCEGDSTWQLNYDLKPSSIIGLEPERDNFETLISNIKLNKIGNAIPLNIGVGNRFMTARMPAGQGGSSSISTHGNKVVIDKIDNIVKKYSTGKIGLIKMDIEGFEMEAIEGARETIKMNKPVLLIALYHKGKDLFEIPQMIRSINKKYKFRFLNLNKNSATYERWLLAEYL